MSESEEKYLNEKIENVEVKVEIIDDKLERKLDSVNDKLDSKLDKMEASFHHRMDTLFDALFEKDTGIIVKTKENSIKINTIWKFVIGLISGTALAGILGAASLILK